MSVHYLLDGYNILHQLPVNESLSLEERRQHLIHLIEINRPQGSVKNQITIIFDGKKGVIGRDASSTVKIMFSQDESADEKIKTLILKAANRKNFIVVTNDNGIVFAVRALGASIITVQEFLAKIRSPQSQKPAPSFSRERETMKRVSSVAASNINSELSAIWLKRKKFPKS